MAQTMDRLLDGRASAVVDLHGMTAKQCRELLPQRLAILRKMYGGKIVHIITGKGKGSIGQPVLKNIVANLLRSSLRSHLHDFSEDVDGGGYLIKMR
jgi:DNA-nicking Smr family endonuclease